MATKLIKVNIDDLKETEHNPRQITKKEFEKLKPDYVIWRNNETTK